MEVRYVKKKNKKNYKKLEKAEMKKIKGGADRAGWRLPLGGANPLLPAARRNGR